MENDIDKLFKQAASNEKGSFNPAFFEEMNAMMIADAKSKRKKKLFFYFLNGLILLIGIGSLGYYFNAENKDIVDSKIAMNESLSSEKTTESNVSFASIESNENSNKLVENNLSSNPDIDNHISTEKTELKTILNEDNITASNLSSTHKSNSNKAFSKEIKLENKKPNTSITNSGSSTKNKGVISSTKSNQKSNSEKSLVSNEEKNDNSDIEKKGLALETKKPTDANSISFQRDIMNQFSPKGIEVNPFYQDPYLTFDIPKEDLDSINKMLPKTSILLGLNNHLGWDSKWNHSPMIGLNYHHPINPKLAFEASLFGYYADNIIKDSTYTLEYYDIGFTRQITNVDTKRLYMIDIPIGISYSFRDKISIKMNGIYSRLLNSKTIFESETTNFRKEIISQQSKSIHYGTFGELRKNSLAFSTGVEYKVNKNWSILLDGYFGGQNISFISNEDSNIRSIRLMIKYRLF